MQSDFTVLNGDVRERFLSCTAPCRNKGALRKNKILFSKKKKKRKKSTFQFLFFVFGSSMPHAPCQ